MVTMAQSPQEAHCPQAFAGLASRCRVPHGTIQCLRKDIQSRVLVTIQDDATACADVGADTQTFLDQCSTHRAVLGSPLWRHGDDRNVMHQAVGFDPGQELPPSRIVDGREPGGDS